jgi:hypothetical protein
MEPRAQAVSVYIDGQPRRRAQLLLLSVVSLPVRAFSAPVHLPYIYPVHPDIQTSSTSRHPDIQTSSTSRLPCPPTTSPIPPAAHRCAVFCARLPRPTKHCASRATTATFAPNCLIRRRARCLARPLATLQDTSSLTAFWRPRPARRPLLAARCSLLASPASCPTASRCSVLVPSRVRLLSKRIVRCTRRRYPRLRTGAIPPLASPPYTDHHLLYIPTPASLPTVAQGPRLSRNPSKPIAPPPTASAASPADRLSPTLAE